MSQESREHSSEKREQVKTFIKPMFDESQAKLHLKNSFRKSKVIQSNLKKKQTINIVEN